MIVALILVAGPILLSAVLWLGWQSARLAELSADQHMANQAASVADNVERWDHYFVMALENLRGQPDILNMYPPDQIPVLQQMQKSYERLAIVRVTRADGISVARTDGTAPMDYGDRDWFKACMGGRSVTREALITKTGHKAALNFSMPILDEKGKIVGVLSAVTYLTSMSDVLGISAGDPGEEIFVVDERGLALAAPLLQRTDSLTDLRGSPPVQRLLHGQDGAMAFTDSSGTEWFAQAVKLSNGWSIVCQIPKQAVIAQSKEMMRTAYALAVSALLFLAGLGGLVAKKMTRPIRELTGAADDLACGNWSRRVRGDGADELGRLASSFNKMAGHLEAAYRQAEARSLELQKANEALQASEERYALAIRGANDGLWDWDLKTGRVHYSARWKEMLGCEDAQIGDSLQHWISRVHPDDLESIHTAIAAHREQVTPHFEVEHRLLHTDGRYRWMLARGTAVWDGAGQATRMAGSLTDVTARREAEEQLLEDALHERADGDAEPRALLRSAGAVAVADDAGSGSRVYGAFSGRGSVQGN